jgi:hypothetical protein
VTADAAAIRDVYTEAGELRGVWTRGEEPRELVLSDGSRLSLADHDQGEVHWHRSATRDGEDGTISFDRALELAGEGFTDYVRVRTRAEAGWLRSVADWCACEADRLEREAGSSH